jgi:hypothetical protein
MSQQRAHSGERHFIPRRIHRRPAFAVQPRMAVTRQHRRIRPDPAALNASAIA